MLFPSPFPPLEGFYFRTSHRLCPKSRFRVCDAYAQLLGGERRQADHGDRGGENQAHEAGLDVRTPVSWIGWRHHTTVISDCVKLLLRHEMSLWCLTLVTRLLCFAV